MFEDFEDFDKREGTGVEPPRQRGQIVEFGCGYAIVVVSLMIVWLVIYLVRR